MPFAPAAHPPQSVVVVAPEMERHYDFSDTSEDEYQGGALSYWERRIMQRVGDEPFSWEVAE